MILRAFLALAIVLHIKIADSIFGCRGHDGHTICLFEADVPV